MIYKNKDNFIVTCNCGCCQGLNFRILDNLIFISAIESSFYSHQNFSTNKYKNILKRIFKKKIYMIDIIFNKDEKDDLIKSLYELYNKIIDSTEINENDSLLKAYKINIFNKNDYDEFGLYIQSKQKIKDIIKNKQYRTYEIIYNKEEFLIFIKSLEKYLN